MCRRWREGGRGVRSQWGLFMCRGKEDPLWVATCNHTEGYQPMKAAQGPPLCLIRVLLRRVYVLIQHARVFPFFIRTWGPFSGPFPDISQPDICQRKVREDTRRSNRVPNSPTEPPPGARTGRTKDRMADHAYGMTSLWHLPSVKCDQFWPRVPVFSASSVAQCGGTLTVTGTRVPAHSKINIE